MILDRLWNRYCAICGLVAFPLLIPLAYRKLGFVGYFKFIFKLLKTGEFEK